MNKFVNQLLLFAADARRREEEMNKEFKARAAKEEQKYWDACKYPRKTKKRMRKEALADYQFYIFLSKPLIFT